MSTPFMVEVRRLSKAYGFLWALKDVSFELGPGDCAALLGPNGAGKTTLLKLLSGLIAQTSGEIRLAGAKPARALNDSIGFFSPNEHLYEGLTAIENLGFFAALYDKQKTPGDLEAALEGVGLSRWAREPVSSLSAGMKCRLTLAKWIVLAPRLLLLDEPYGVLDGAGVELLEGYLQALCRSGGIVLIATHHIGRILKVCSRAFILQQGQLIFDERRQEPWESFRRTYAEFLPKGEPWAS
jgi:heme ABC exporter ATP-binding subunit CcmA